MSHLQNYSHEDIIAFTFVACSCMNLKSDFGSIFSILLKNDPQIPFLTVILFTRNRYFKFIFKVEPSTFS